MKNIKLIELGVDGGGFEVHRLEYGRVVETGSSGGMLDEEEDPIKSWENHFDSFEVFFEDFKEKQKDFWIHFYPAYIDESIRSYILHEVKKYPDQHNEKQHSIENWFRALHENDNYK